MRDDKIFLAIDLGASSGRAILGTVQNNQLNLKEINRFPNPIININGRLYWDFFRLYDEIIKSLKLIGKSEEKIESIGIDTWGVDFVCFGKDGEALRMPYSYRNRNTVRTMESFFESVMSQEELYQKTGIQILNFNTLFQLASLTDEKSSTLPVIDKILFMPDALSFLLTGKMVTEYTIASTSQMLNPYRKKFDNALLKTVGFSEEYFAPIVFAGEKIGNLSHSVMTQTGCDSIPVVAVAGHDTASAILAIPAENKNFAYLSSGTWSLMGIESENPVINDNTFRLGLTNEGAADGSTRLLKNICGMWLIEQCKKEWNKEREISYDEIVSAAQKAEPFRSFINPDSPCFASPISMIEAIRDYCLQTNQHIPRTMGEIARCIYESLAFRYKQTLDILQELATFDIEKLHIIGGGSQNNMLNSFTANAIGLTVIAGPSEATAMGNILIQAKTAGLVKSKQEIRQIVKNSVELSTFKPQDISIWEAHYKKYTSVFKEI